MSDLNTTVRVRLAPSPTGFVHIGTARIALFNYLFAKKNNGQALLRVEDTDQSRLVEGAMEDMLRVMKKLGIVFDEGPFLNDSNVIEQRGDKGPYIQSQRLEMYHQYVEELLANSKAYYCFCTAERLDEVRKEQVALKKPPMYDKHCRNLSQEEITSKLESGQQKVVRQAIPENGTTVIHDLVYGQISYENALLDDQVLLKSDGFPTYHLAVVIDDHLMEISHVMRGEEWIPSTPKHLLLYEAFGWQAPQYAHMPLILNKDRTKLSKRQGDVAVEDFLKKGYLPEALVNFIAFLGWNPKTEQEIFSMEELIEQFDLAKVNNSGAVLDMDKLDWMNSHYIRAKSNTELLGLLTPYLQELSVDVTAFNTEYLEAVIEIEKERMKTLSQIADHASIYFKDVDYQPEILVWKKADKADAIEKLTGVKNWLSETIVSDFERADIEAKLKEWIASQEFQTGNVLWPLRVALTGLEKSPSPFEMLWSLYKKDKLETINNRLDTAISKLQ